MPLKRVRELIDNDGHIEDAIINTDDILRVRTSHPKMFVEYDVDMHPVPGQWVAVVLKNDVPDNSFFPQEKEHVYEGTLDDFMPNV